MLYCSKNSVFFCLLNNSVVVYDKEFQQILCKFNFEYNFDYLLAQNGILIAKCRGFYRNFLLISWNTKNNTLKPLYYDIGHIYL